MCNANSSELLPFGRVRSTVRSMEKTRYGVWHSLRVVRERSGWASADLARNTTLNEKPMSPGYLSDLENGKRWPNPKVIAALARALNVPYTVLERHDAPEDNSAA